MTAHRKKYLQDYCRMWAANHREERRSYLHKWRIANRESATLKESNLAYQKRYAAKFPERVKARETVNNAVKAGKIIRPTLCQDCGNGGRLHGHHADYSKPLSVEWLCVSCHRRRHSQLFANLVAQSTPARTGEKKP